MIEIVGLALLGVAAGLTSGLFGVGGGVVFVPALTLIVGLGQLEAEATSLAAMVPVVAIGAWRQHRVGLVDWQIGIVVGLVSIVGVLAGAEVATSLADRELEVAFGLFLIAVAGQLAWRALRPPPATS
jgi:uncharacterized membrane protein YfcA